MHEAPPIRLLGLSGSLRKHSYCTAVLVALQQRIQAAAELTLFPLHAVPLYDQDFDTAEAPPAVAALRQAIRQSDGLVVISPEYNYGMSGVIKNALDWASRPYGESSLQGKIALTLSASPAFTGGVRAQYQLRETLIAARVRVVARPDVVIGSVHEKIRDGRFTDEAALGFALGAMDDLIAEIRLLRSGSRNAMSREA